MIGPATGVRVYLACGVTDMRKGIAGLAAGIGPRVDLKNRLGTLARIRNEALGLPQLLSAQAGKQAAEFGRDEAGHGGSPQASEASAYLSGT